MSNPSPIGVFDSGLGGLTVLRSLCKQFPKENFIYLGDTARLPYGTKSERTIRSYLLQNIELMQRKEVKALVIACNSASSALLQEKVDIDFPIYNVIEPGSKLAARITRNNRIGVIATRATVLQRAYATCLQRMDPELKVYQQACPLLVPLVEEGWHDDPVTNLILYRYLSQLLEVGIDTLILGCTHYPTLKASIAKITGPSIQLVDTADAIGALVMQGMGTKKIIANDSQGTGSIQLLTTDFPQGFKELASQMLSPIVPTRVEWIDLKTD